MVTNIISQLEESFPLRAGSFEISFTKWLPPPLFAPATKTRLRGEKTVQLPVTFSMSCQIFKLFQIDTFSELEELSGRFVEKKSCVLCRNFTSIYKIKRTLHGRLGIRILSSRADRYFQHSKIKFASPCGHVISSISAPQKQQRNELQKQVRNIRSVRTPVLSNQTTISH